MREMEMAGAAGAADPAWQGEDERPGRGGGGGGGMDRQRLLHQGQARSSSTSALATAGGDNSVVVVGGPPSRTGLTPRTPFQLGGSSLSLAAAAAGGGGGASGPPSFRAMVVDGGAEGIGGSSTGGAAGGGSAGASGPRSARKWSKDGRPAPPASKCCRARRVGCWLLALLPALVLVLSGVMAMHIFLVRHAASGRLSSILQIISAAEYYPIRNGLHSEVPELQAHVHRRALLLREERENAALALAAASTAASAAASSGGGGGEVVAVDIKAAGEVATEAPAAASGEAKQVAVGDEAPAPAPGPHSNLRKAKIAGPPTTLQGTQYRSPSAAAPATSSSSSSGGGGEAVAVTAADNSTAAAVGAGAGVAAAGEAVKMCPLTYRMNLTEKEAQTMDVDTYDQELLGTIMVRLCNCGCAKATDAVGTEVGAEDGQLAARPRPPKDSLQLMAEILRGAHIVVEGDRGAFYSWFTQMQDSYRRTSSHVSSAPMYGIDEGSVLRTVLTGRDLEGSTWLQFEGAGWDPWRRPIESLAHAINYVQYRLTGRQVGPLGNSPFTDSKPIRLSFDGCLDRRDLGPAPTPGGTAGGAGGGGDDGGDSLFKQYDRDDPTGKDVTPTHRRWDQALSRAHAAATEWFAWGSGTSGGDADKAGGDKQLLQAEAAPEAGKAGKGFLNKEKHPHGLLRQRGAQQLKQKEAAATGAGAAPGAGKQ